MFWRDFKFDHFKKCQFWKIFDHFSQIKVYVRFLNVAHFCIENIFFEKQFLATIFDHYFLTMFWPLFFDHVLTIFWPLIGHFWLFFDRFVGLFLTIIFKPFLVIFYNFFGHYFFWKILIHADESYFSSKKELIFGRKIHFRKNSFGGVKKSPSWHFSIQIIF